MTTEIRKVLTSTNGVNTTLGTVTSEPVWQNLDDINVDQGVFRRRLGKTKLYQFPVISDLIDADGVNDTVALGTDARIWPLGTRFTVKTLFVTDTLGGYVLGRTGATVVGIKIQHTSASSGSVVATVTDSAAAVTTLTWTGVAASTKCALMVARDGATLRGVLNGTVATGTMTATTTLATGTASSLYADNGANFYDGAIDHFTILSTYETSQRDGWLRHMNPRADNVVADWLGTLDAAGHMIDRGMYEAHGTSAGSPSSTRAPLCLNPDPVMAVSSNLDTSGRRQLYAMVGPSVYVSFLP